MWRGLPETPVAADVVGKGHGNQDQEGEEASADGEHHHFRAVADVHEKENDQDSLETGDRERHDGAEYAHVDKSRTGCNGREYQQREQDEPVGLGTDDVMFVFRRSGHVLSSYFKGWRLMRYSSGKRKIQTISTKCQYSPKLSMVEVCPFTYAP